jgi:uncharacterized protein
MRVVVTGGTGLIGRRIVSLLRDRGDDVVVVSRSAKPMGDVRTVAGDPTVPGEWLSEVEACDGVIHLAGESIAGGRWTKAFKERVLQSRIAGTTLIAQTLAKRPLRDDGTPRVMVSTSAVGYYGSTIADETEYVETDLPGNGFLADVCVLWEGATEPAKSAGVRVPVIRVGIVLAADGGALPKMLTPFRWFVGGPVGKGKQWMSWIHLDDIASLFVFALHNPNADGPINGVAPEPVTNWGFSHILGKVLKRPCWLPVPPFALGLLMGEMAMLATQGQRVAPVRAKELGFEFQYPLPEKAIRVVLGKELPDDDDWLP